MIQISLSVKEFAEGAALAKCDVLVRLFVAPRFEFPVPPELEERLKEIVLSGGPVFAAAPSGALAIPNAGLTPHIPQASITAPKSARTDANGNVSFLFDVSDEFRQVQGTEFDPAGSKVPRPTTTLPIDVKAYPEIEIRIASYTNKRRFMTKALDEDSQLREDMVIDFAKSIVGHTGRRRVRLWFCLHGSVGSEDGILCVLRGPKSAGGKVIASKAVEKGVNPAIVRFTDLDPGASFRYEFRYQTPADQGKPLRGRVLTSGSFRTRPRVKDAKNVRIAFGSCHLPADEPDDSPAEALNCWENLRQRSDYDTLMLLGDQIYGDEIEYYWRSAAWPERYVNRYHQFWQYPVVRDVLSSVPTYMMLDDHDVVDDYGVADLCEKLSTDDCEERVDAALETYKVFQQALNPGGRREPPFSYRFAIGPAEVFVLDGRTQRTQNRKASEHPILGDAQAQRIREWGASQAVKNADIVIFATGVPLVFFPITILQDAAKALIEQAGKAAAAAGLLNPLLGGGLLLGGATLLFGDDVVELVTQLKLNSPDVEDQWTFEHNQKDLVTVLDVLFDIANGRNPLSGKITSNPKLVLTLGGDAHIATMHLIRSRRDEDRRNPFIYNITSSPISNRPVDEEALVDIIANISGALDVDLIKDRKIILKGLQTWIFGTDNGVAQDVAEKVKERSTRKFFLDDHPSLLEQGRELNRYMARTVAVIPQRNYGMINIRKSEEPLASLYNVDLSINGVDRTVFWEADGKRGFEVNLQASTVRPVAIGTFAKKQGVDDKKDDGPLQNPPVSGGE